MTNKQKEKNQIQPLMYIVQPDYNEVQAQMQTLVVKKNKIDTIENKQPVAVKEKNEKMQESQSNSYEEDQVVKKPEKKRRKPISQMSIAEKVDFFTNLPRNIPKTLCQIETETDTYRGIIITEENGLVHIRTLGEPNEIKLQIEEIKSITLLGF
ncbi:CotO family spore coat protein [Metabacillus arenae]|uniref:Spore coat protein CotO n=1 Tax=Metabacillus arenae TaxID=2771434 RepID=A0A926RZ61_9BACI|nr:CotO family spore coat protein [Metabacillus arenae]MBD1381902.1 hypothetical protein [Metabacillus arenae]